MSTNNVVMSNGHAPPQVNHREENNNNNSNGFKSTQLDSKRLWSIKSSPVACDTINPIRKIVEGLNLTPNKEKPFIPLSIGKHSRSCYLQLRNPVRSSGDPTIFGNFKPHQAIIEAMVKSVRSDQFNGYQPASGHQEARAAVAEYCAAHYDMNVTFKVGNLFCSPLFNLLLLLS